MAIQLTLRGLVLSTPPPAVLTARPLWGFPDIAAADLCENAVLVGAAGEALVDSLLLRHGLLPLAMPGSLSCDRIVWMPGGAFRLQVKTTVNARGGSFTFNAARGYRGAPQGRRAYGEDDYDVLALVALSEDVVAFTAEVRSHHRIPVAAVPGLRADLRATLTEALLRLGLDPDAAPPDADPAADAKDAAPDPEPDLDGLSDADLALPPMAA